MILIGLSVILFFITAVLHIIIHRTLLARGITTFTTVIVFGIGFVVTIAVVLEKGLLGRGMMPLSALFLYIFLVADYLAFFASPYFGEESPSSKVYLYVKHKKKATIEEIRRIFSKEELVEKRLDDMLKSDWIKRRKDRYYLLHRGKTVLRLIEVYRRLLGWKLVG